MEIARQRIQEWIEQGDVTQTLNFYNLRLTSLPTLPYTLQSLNCSYNDLTELPTLPNTLQYIHCSDNKLTSLPTLPNSLLNLFCYDNKLTELPTLPDTLQILSCYDNKLTSLPTLPDTLQYLNYDNNKYLYIPRDIPRFNLKKTKNFNKAAKTIQNSFRKYKQRQIRIKRKEIISLLSNLRDVNTIIAKFCY